MSLTDLGVGIVAGLGLGSMFALMAMSFSLVVSASGIFNFALESVVSIAAISSYLLLDRAGLPLPVAAILVLLVGGTLGIIMYFVVARPFEGRSGAEDYTGSIAVATIGFALAVDSLVGLLFGPNPQAVTSYVTNTPLIIGSVPIRYAYVVMFCTLVLVAGVGEWVFRRTRAGLLMRTVQHDRDGSALLGIDGRRVVRGVFVVSGVIAAVTGFLLAPVTYASSTVGTTLLIPAFAAMAIGGFGSFQGAIAGGLGIGMIEGIGPFLIPVNAIDPVIFATLVAVLLIKPTGLAGLRGRRAV